MLEDSIYFEDGGGMLSQTTIKRACKPVVLRRAQRMVDDGDRIFKRTCRFDEGETVLKARVDSNSSWDEAYRTSVMIDEEADAITYYECDCRPRHAADSPCDHVVALLLDFVINPGQYEGYDAKDALLTSRGLLRLMEKATSSLPTRTKEASTEVGTGTIHLEPTLSYEVGFSVRFRISGSKGAYALKSISEFVERVEDRAFGTYGGRLAFGHALHSFAPPSRNIVEFLTRAIQNRRAFAQERVVGRSLHVPTASMPAREMHLSSPELWELLSLCEDEGILFEDRSVAPVGEPAPHLMGIVQRDPEVRICIEPVDGGFELLRSGEERVVRVGGRALAWDESTFYCCSKNVSKNVGLLAAMLANPSERMLVSNEDAPLFCASVLRQLESCSHVLVPPQLEEVRPCACELQFYLDYNAHRSLVSCEARAVYGDKSLPLFDTTPANGADDAPAVIRDARAEAQGREIVRRFFSVKDGMAFCVAQGEDLGVIAYEGVAALQEVGSVFAYPAFERLRNKARPKVRVGLSVRSRLLEMEMRVEGLAQEELAGLLESYRKKRPYHQLSDGSVVRMEDADLRVAGMVADELELEPKQIGTAQALPAYRAFVLDGLLGSEEKDYSFEAYVDGMRRVSLDSFELPASLEGVLRPYQKEGYKWLCGLSAMGLGGVLADEMGLGKSVQLISFLLARVSDIRQVGPALVVCPSSLVYNWEAELKRFAPQLRSCVVTGTPQERMELLGKGRDDVLITSYDLLRRDIAEYEGKRLWCVALDEAQYIKNPVTQSAQAAKRLVASNRLALTGTPVENRLSELWSIFDFLMPGLLGSYDHFRERFERPIVEDEDANVASHLREALRPFILRRSKRDVAADLPEKIEQIVYTHMGHEQRRLYDAQVQEVRTMVAQQDGKPGGGKFQILALLTRLRQVCCDPSLLYEGYAEPSCKTDAILTLVERAMDAGEKTLVFSQFTSYLSVIASELSKRGVAHYVITGATPSAQRMNLVNAFNQDDTPVFLISLKAGGTGLNLTGATVVVHADPWWNAAAQNQATDRAHRIGQTREVTVYKVIASHSIEERIVELQRSKSELADAVVQGDVSGISLSSLTREDLEDLLG